MRIIVEDMSKRPVILHILNFFVFPGLVCVFIASIPSAALSYDVKKKKQIGRIEIDLSREKEQSLKLEVKETDLLGQLAEIEKRIAEKRRSLDRVKEGLRVHQKELRTQDEKLKQLEGTSRGVRDKLAERLVAFYKYAKRGYVHLFASSNNIEQMRKRMKYLQIIMAEDQRLLKELDDVQKAINQEIALVRERLSVIEEMKEAESARVSAVKEELDKKVFLLMKVHKEKEFHDTLVEELQMGAENLGQTLLYLDREQKEEKALPSGFVDAKGKLPLPLPGKIMKNQDWWGVEVANTHKGIFIQGPMGAEVQSVFPGRVDFSGRLKGYGEIIIINHGSRYFTISAYLSEKYKEEGDMVEASEAIGLLGDAGPSDKPQLYFEIRRAGTPLNPLKWVKGH